MLESERANGPARADGSRAARLRFGDDWTAVHGLVDGTKMRLSTPVHKFGNVWCYAAGRSDVRAASSLFRRSSRSARVKFHSKGVAMRS